METTNIPYSRKHLNTHLIFGLVWLLYSIFLLTYNDDLHWTNFGWLFISFMYLGVYFYNLRMTYITINKEEIKLNSMFGKRLKRQDIISIKKFAGDYILKTNDQQMTINLLLMDSDSVEKLNQELNKLDVEWI